jgi:hypothetical protein
LIDFHDHLNGISGMHTFKIGNALPFMARKAVLRRDDFLLDNFKPSPRLFLAIRTHLTSTNLQSILTGDVRMFRLHPYSEGLACLQLAAIYVYKHEPTRPREVLSINLVLLLI